LTIPELWAAQLERQEAELAYYYRRFAKGKHDKGPRKVRVTGYVRNLWADIEDLIRKTSL
jgi:hypothetical protein